MLASLLASLIFCTLLGQWIVVFFKFFDRVTEPQDYSKKSVVFWSILFFLDCVIMLALHSYVRHHVH